MDPTKIAAVGLAACAVLGVTLGCSGGISLAGDGDDEHAPDALAEADATEAADVDVDGVPDDGIVDAPDTGDGDTCPVDAISGGGCTTPGATCRTATFCQQCAIDAWTWFAADCWCAGGSWNCTHIDCYPYAPGTYSDPGGVGCWTTEARWSAVPDEARRRSMPTRRC
ncbi:MAG: hypothetical protein HY907_12595 [Deltaproteobacteria bacterium]|nr:hypothetical protein [Deltaproteobacteria bacterium]